MRTVILGDLSVDKVFECDGGMPMAFSLPQVTTEDLARLGTWYWDETLDPDPASAMFTLSTHSYVLRIAGKVIVVDTCQGNGKHRTVPLAHMLDTAYLDNLAKAGVRPEEVDYVMCTHLHADHVGWNTRLVDGHWVPTFPNARYVMGRRDHAFFSGQTHEAFHREAYDDSILPVIRAGQAEIVDEDSAILGAAGDGVWLEPAFGHSAGSCLIHARAGGPQAVFSGDTFHHPVQLVRPDYPFFFDHDGPAAVAVRKALLDRVADTDTVVFPAHFRKSSAGRVQRDGAGFRFVFVDD